jgi:hypothetical protein
VIGDATTTTMMAPMWRPRSNWSSAPSIGSEPSKGTGKESADECADDAQDDVPDDTETLVTLDEEPGQVPGDGAEHQPRDDVHLILHFPRIYRPWSGHGHRLWAAGRQACRYGAAFPLHLACSPLARLRWARKARAAIVAIPDATHPTIGLALPAPKRAEGDGDR